MTCAGIAAEPGAYDVTVETVMPHLEESLRYATIRERRCVAADGFASLFPALHYASLEGCTLTEHSRSGNTLRYGLVCPSVKAATGVAWLKDAAGRVTGALEIKMGGKNMTFTQRVEAIRRGECEPAR